MLKWTVFSILLATLPLIIAGFSIIQTYQENLKKSVLISEKEKVNIVVEKTRSFLEKITSNLRSLSMDEHFRIGDSSDHLRGLLERFLYQNDFLSELTFLNEKGKETIKVSKYRVFKPKDLKDQSKTGIYQVASNGRTYYGNFKLTEDVVPTIVIAVPIEEFRGRPTGVLSAEIHLRYLWNLIPQTQIGKKGITYVVDGEGDLIAHPDTRRVLSKMNVRHLPMVDWVIAGKEGSLEFEPLKGEKQLVVYKPIKELGWGVIVEVPVEEAYEPIKKVAYTAILWVLIALTIAILCSLFLTRKLIHPIKELSLQMAEVSQGNLNARMTPSTRDEIGLLTESFNRMIQDLKQSRETLRETEEKYSNIFKNLKDMVYITSLEGQLIDVNPAGVKMLGYSSKDELMGVNSKDIYLNPEERDRFVNEMKQEGFVNNFESKLIRKDGTSIDALISANVRRNSSEEIIGFEGIIKNITYRKGIEKELVQRAEELQVLYELSTLTNQTLDVEKILSITMDKVSQLIGFEMGAVHLLQPDGETLELKTHKGFSPQFVEYIKTLQYGEGVAGNAIKLQRPVIVSIEDYPSPRLKSLLKEEGNQSFVGVPFLAKGKAIGSLTLSSRSSRVLAAREINLLESIGNQIGLAIENAQLFSAVAKAKSEWETTFDAVTDLITIRDREHRIIRANKAAFKRYGMEAKWMIGKKCHSLLHHREIPCEDCYIAATLELKKPISGVRDSEYLNGVFRYYTFPIYDEQREIIAVVDLAREITEERRLEIEKEVINNVNKSLASSLDIRQVMKAVHGEFKRILNTEGMTITLLDEKEAGFRYFALEKDYETEKILKDRVYPIEGTAFEKAVHTGVTVMVNDTAQKDSWINQQLFREGIRSSLVFPLKYKGKVIGTINFESKQAGHFSEDHVSFLRQMSAGLAISIENALLLDEIKASEEKYRTVVEGTLDGVCVIGENYQLKYVNEKLIEIQGYSRDELIGTDFRKFLDEKSMGLLANREEQRKRGTKLSPHFELTILRKDGDNRKVEISARSIKDTKGIANIIVILKDITEEKRMREQLLQAEKLRAIGEMTSGIAHDFNNALAAILGNTQLLIHTIQDEEAKEALQTIEKVAKDSAHTVRRLQDFTKKKVHQELLTLDINSVIQDAITITRPKWKDETQGRGINIEMVSHLEENPIVVGVASELREVFTNMIFNAVEAMPEGGKIEIRTFRRKGKVYIEIADTGIGINEEMKKKIFEPFFTTKPFSNTGLGLSMCYGMIHRMGGEIEVESNVGKGTTFTIILPVGGERKEEVAFPSMIKKGREGRILVIDDEESVRKILSKILSQVNHQVKVARNGEEGIRLVKEKEFDLVLTDLGMPGISGWEVCKTVKRMYPYLPVGMITGWGMELDQERVKETGVDFVVSKPFDFNQILKIVAETMELKEKRFSSLSIRQGEA